MHPSAVVGVLLWTILIGSIWESLGVSGSIWKHLGASGSIWEYLGASGSIWEHLGASGSICELLGASGSIWELLGVSGSIWEHLGVPGSIWEHLGASGSIWEHLVVVVASWGIWAHLGASPGISGPPGISKHLRFLLWLPLLLLCLLPRPHCFSFQLFPNSASALRVLVGFKGSNVLPGCWRVAGGCRRGVLTARFYCNLQYLVNVTFKNTR